MRFNSILNFTVLVIYARGEILEVLKIINNAY